MCGNKLILTKVADEGFWVPAIETRYDWLQMYQTKIGINGNDPCHWKGIGQKSNTQNHISQRKLISI